MAGREYPRRYSQAVFQIALEAGELDSWQSDLKKIADLSREALLVALLESPKLRFDDKTKLLAERLGDIKPLARNLVYLLLERGKLSLAVEIAEHYQELLDNYRGIEHAEVLTAIPIDDKDKPLLEERLGAIVGKKVLVKAKADSSLIGGIIARIDGKLIDGSTRSRLEALKKEMSGVSK